MDEVDDQSNVNCLYSSSVTNCLTITEENEEELEQLKLADQQSDENPSDGIKSSLDMVNQSARICSDECELLMERLSTIFESPSPQPSSDDQIVDSQEKLIVLRFRQRLHTSSTFSSNAQS